MRTRSARTLLMIALSVYFGFGYARAAAQHRQAQPQNRPAAAQAQQPANDVPADAQRPVLRQRYPRYRIRPSDVIDLAFRFTPEFNQEVAVQPDGYIQARGLQNDVYVQGLTVSEMTTALEKAYANILNQPEISVTLKDFDRPYFVAGGLVGKPGKY